MIFNNTVLDTETAPYYELQFLISMIFNQKAIESKEQEALLQFLISMIFNTTKKMIGLNYGLSFNS